MEIKENNLGEEGIKQLIVILYQSKSLVHLDITSNQISNTAASILFESLGHNESVHCLIMGNSACQSRNSIRPEGYKRCTAALIKNKTLGILNISGNLAGNQGIAHIVAGLQLNKTLQSLNISQTNLSGESVSSIIKLLKDSRIIILDVSKNNLGNNVIVDILIL